MYVSVVLRLNGDRKKIYQNWKAKRKCNLLLLFEILSKIDLLF